MLVVCVAIPQTIAKHYLLAPYGNMHFVPACYIEVYADSRTSHSIHLHFAQRKYIPPDRCHFHEASFHARTRVVTYLAEPKLQVCAVAPGRGAGVLQCLRHEIGYVDGDGMRLTGCWVT